MKYLLVLFLLFSSPAYAQFGGGVSSTGTITATHCAEWFAPNVLEDSGSTCGGGGSSTLSIGTTTITGGTNTYIEYNNNGVLGEYAVTGTGTAAVLSTSPTFTTGLTAPLVIGGTAAGSTLTLESTSGSGTTDSILFKTGSQTTQLNIGTQTIAASEMVSGGTPLSLTISTATFTPTFGSTSNDFVITLVHASCPCTLANPSGPITAGTKGMIYIIQSATGSDTITTWGSDYLSAGGTSTITLSTGASAIDVFSYAVKDSTHIVLSAGALNVSH